LTDRTSFVKPSKPEGLLLILFKAPVFLYSIGLGRLFGRRFMLLTHEGRRSQKLRKTVLEVIRYDPDTRESLVISAYGEDADWYRNIRRKEAIQVCTGGECFAPMQRFLSGEEARDAFLEYESRSGPYLRRLLKLLGIEYDGSEEAREQLLTFMRMVAFRPAK
jgi:deazaflavin-dependent oxidoreductase (nitroreductase family)